MKSDIFTWNLGTDIAKILDETVRYGDFTGLSHKETEILRLLGEEMLGMTKSILTANNCETTSEVTFFIENEAKDFVLRCSVKAQISEEAKYSFLRASKDGKNVSEKGVLGKLRGIFESMIMNSDEVFSNAPPSVGYMHGYIDSSSTMPMMWSVSAYTDTLDKDKDKEKWDDIEKEILLNYSDDIIIGVTINGAEITVKKSFN